MTGDWRYLAGRIVGDGTIDIIESDLPISIDSVTRSLSSPSTMSGSIDNEVKRLKVNGVPIFQTWNTVIIAEADDLIRGMTIYRKPTFNGAVWELNQVGLSAYPQGMPYVGAKLFVGEDPLNIFRHIWSHVQSQKNGNLGITLDGTTSPVRVGSALQQVQFNAETQPGVSEKVAFEAGPRKLNWYETLDLGREIDDYAKETPFDWMERFFWLGDQPHCHLALGYPQLGGRKDNLRFVLGENLETEPSITETEYVNQVYVLGAGEGRQRVQGYAGVTDNRLRRAKTVEDPSKKSVAAANSLASTELNKARGGLLVEQLVIHDHPNARIAGIELGDEIQLYAETDWALVDQYVRVVAKTEAPGKSDVATLTVVRPDGGVAA